MFSKPEATSPRKCNWKDSVSISSWRQAIISWPAHLPEGEVRDQLGTGCDWLPTIAELCSVELPKRKLDGKSLVRVIKSAAAASPHQVFHWQMRNSWAVREADWKLLGNPRDTSEDAKDVKLGKLFLVNLKEDVGERRNVVSANPKIVERLQRLHDEWASQLSD